MTNLAADIRDFVTDKVTNAAQAISDSLPKRKVALITGITGQVSLISNEILVDYSIGLI